MAVEYQVKYTPGFDPTIVNVSQNDVGRQFDLKIIDETGAAQQIPSGSTVKFVGMKPSGLGFTVNCTFTNSVVHVTTTDIMTDEHGLIPAEVQITNGNTVIGTANVNLRVEKNPHPEGTIDDNLIRIIPTFDVIYQRLDILESSMYTAENNISKLKTRMGTVEDQADDAYALASQAADMAHAQGIEIGGIRRGYDGTVYQTAGDAVRAQAFRGTDTTLSVDGMAADAAAVGNIKSDLNYYADTNIFEGATWQQGYYVSVATFSNETVNANNARICTQIELSDNYPLGMLIAILDSNYNYECGLFDENGSSLGYKRGWQTADWNYSGTKFIKYIRLNIRKSNNTNISVYNGEIKGFRDGYKSILDTYKGIQKNLSKIEVNSTKLDLIKDNLGVIFLDGSNWELGSISNGSLVDSTIRARTTDYIDISGEITVISVNDSLEFGIVTYDDNNIWQGDTSYKSGSYSVKLNTRATKIKLIVKHKIAPYPISLYEFDSFIFLISKQSTAGNNIRLTIMSHNCGHFNYGSSNEYSGDDMTEKIDEWKAMIARNKPDIILGQELSQYFDANKTTLAYDTLYKPLLPYTYFLSYGRVISKFKIIKSWNEDITVEISGTTYARSVGCAIVEVEGINILICSAHFIPGYDTTADAVREAEKAKLIESFSNYDHVIIGGDFNASTDSFYDDFETAGYVLANHGYFGTIETFPNESVDNIIVKGFTFYNAKSSVADKCTSDHYPIVSDIHIN